MHSIIIVDDEKRECDGIRNLIRRFGIDLCVATASNGEEALAKFETCDYDILLTDIKMPYMDGLQLVKAVKQLGKNPVCIIYSAYNEFEYAQSAISLGVTEYLLKPIELEKFKSLFKKVIGLCHARDELLSQQQETNTYKVSREVLGYLDGKAEPDDAQREEGEFSKIGRALEKLIDFDENVCIPVLITSNSSLFTVDWDAYKQEIIRTIGEKPIIINKTDSQTIVLIVQKKEHYRFAETKRRCETLLAYSEGNPTADALIILGSETTGLRALRSEYRALRPLLEYQFFITDRALLVRSELYMNHNSNYMLTVYIDRIYNCARLADYMAMDEEVGKLINYVQRQKGFSAIFMKYSFIECIKKVSEYCGASIDLLPHIEEIYKSRSLEELCAALCKGLNELQGRKHTDEKVHRLVRMAKDVIFEEYGSSLTSVAHIAEKLQVSAVYLSSLFKKETNENLSKYITKFRIEKSKEMLLQTNLRVNDIASRVGYASTSYYISIFKSHEGYSPSQYRRKKDDAK